MPLYDYKCPRCGLEEECLMRSSSDPAPCCPDAACEGQALERQLSKTAPPQFKGDGFYATDYPRRNR
jgi:putative FmdB family regulatory protein